MGCSAYLRGVHIEIKRNKVVHECKMKPNSTHNLINWLMLMGWTAPIFHIH